MLESASFFFFVYFLQLVAKSEIVIGVILFQHISLTNYFYYVLITIYYLKKLCQIDLLFSNPPTPFQREREREREIRKGEER